MAWEYWGVNYAISEFWYQWPKVGSFLLYPHYRPIEKYKKWLFFGGMGQFSLDHVTLHYYWWSSLHFCLKVTTRSPEVAWGQQHNFDDIFLQSNDTDVKLTPLCLSREDAFNGWSWPEVKLQSWPNQVISYIVKRVSTRQTRWRFNCRSVIIR